MLLRRFNENGIVQFRTFIASLQDDKKRPAPIGMLLDENLTEILDPNIESVDADFQTRLEAALYLDKLLTPLNLDDPLGDVGLWCWLTLRFFDQVRPLPLPPRLGFQEQRFVPSDVLSDANLRSKRYHRHLLRNAYQIYRLVEGKTSSAMCFLVQPVHMPGDFIEQFASRQLYLRNPELLATLSTLVVNAGDNSIRPKASSKARRLDDVLAQFDCTWDLGFIVKDLLIPMLPKEFKKFVSAAEDSAATAAP